MTEIDEQCFVLICNNIDVAGVGRDKQVGF